MSKVKNELEELSFQLPRAAGLRVAARRRSRPSAARPKGCIERAEDDASRAKLDEAQVPVIEIDGRIKRLYSIHQKLKRQKIELEQVYDFIALRIITDSR